jgi:two-component system nitrate/nitrite response regulator NarL
MNNLVIASIDEFRAVSWKNGLIDDFVITTIATDKLDRVWDSVERIKPGVLLLDMDLIQLQSSNSVAFLRKLCAETRTIIVSSAIPEVTEWELIKNGARGFYTQGPDSNIPKQIVMAVESGELWARRSLTARLVDELGKTTSKNKAYRASLGLLNKLTQREFDIAVHVGNGHSNKQIAKLCSISESTVKFHLSEAFRKLGVDSRVDLALLLSPNSTSALENSGANANGNLARLIKNNVAEQLNKRTEIIEQQMSAQESPGNDRLPKK